MATVNSYGLAGVVAMATAPGVCVCGLGDNECDLNIFIRVK